MILNVVSEKRLDPLWDHLFPAEQARIVQLLVERVDIHLDSMNVRLRTAGLTKLVGELRERPIDCGTASQRRSQGRRAAASPSRR